MAFISDPRFPPHQFTPNDWERDSATDSTICYAMLETANYKMHGYSHRTQCGQPRKDHVKGKTGVYVHGDGKFFLTHSAKPHEEPWYRHAGAQ